MARKISKSDQTPEQQAEMKARGDASMARLLDTSRYTHWTPGTFVLCENERYEILEAPTRTHLHLRAADGTTRWIHRIGY